MIMNRNYVTEEGLTQLQAELERLQSEDRLELIERLADATTGGDWMDSAERTLVEGELAFVEARIRELELILATAEIIPPDPDPERINVGDTVLLEDDDGERESYTIVGAAETDPEAGRISYQSPLGQALLDHKVGDEIVVHAPGGERRLRVLSLA